MSVPANVKVKYMVQSEEEGGSMVDDMMVDVARNHDMKGSGHEPVTTSSYSSLDQDTEPDPSSEPQGGDNDDNDDDLSRTMALHLRLIPRCLRYDHGPIEATGLTLDAYARAYILMSSIFLGPALLQLASAAATTVTAGANCNDNDAAEATAATTCQVARIYGMKPSSLLSNIAVVTGLLSSCSMPLVGAIVDHTSYRKQLGTYTAYALALVKLIEGILLTPSTWFPVACLQVLSGWLFYAHVVATYAYTSELTQDTTQQTKYNTYFFTVLYAATLIYMAKVLTLAYVFQQDDVGTARLSQLLTAITSGFFFALAWSFFRNHGPLSFTDYPRTAPHRLFGPTTLATVGFYKVGNTIGHIYRTMPALQRIMGSVLFAESAMNTIITIATTYMTTLLDMSSSEIGVVFLLVLIMGIPGAKLGEFLALRINPLASAKLCILLFLITTTLAAMVLRGPHHKPYAKFFGILWGISMGWLHPMHTVLFLGLIPDNARTEFMGIYIFCQQALSWLPPLVFTILNEFGASMGIGLASLDIFFLLGFISLQSIGKYDQLLTVMAVPATKTDDHVTTNPPTATELPSIT